MAIDKVPINDRLIDNVPGAPPPDDTPDEEPIEPQKPDLTCTPDPTKTKAHRQVVGLENAGGKAYGKATGLYNKHGKYSEQWNPWHPFLVLATVPGPNRTVAKLAVLVVNKPELPTRVRFHGKLPTRLHWAGCQRVAKRVHL